MPNLDEELDEELIPLDEEETDDEVKSQEEEEVQPDKEGKTIETDETVEMEYFKKLGIECNSVREGLEKLVAESEGTDVETVKKNLTEKQRRAEADKLLAMKEVEDFFKSEIVEINKVMPNLGIKTIDDLKSMPNVDTFMECRGKGYSVKAALFEADESIFGNLGKASKQHLKSVATSGENGEELKPINEDSFKTLKEIYPEKTNKEIKELLRKVS